MKANRKTLDQALALLFARGVLGFIFFMAGVWKVFTLTPAGHVRKFFLPYSDTFLPIWSLWVVGFSIPFIELIGGAMVLVGWRVRAALIGLGCVLVTVTFGHLLKDPLYPFNEHVIPRLALVLFILMLPSESDLFSLDHLIGVAALRKRLRKDEADESREEARAA